VVRLHLVDGTYELFRAHHSPRPGAVAPDGRDVKATRGVLSALVSLLDDPDEAVTHLAIAFDNPITSFRNEMFDGYKDGSGTDPALLAQFDLVEEAVAALGVVVWRCVDEEADDALASAAVQLAEEVEQVRILTPDKDLAQVVRGRRVVQVDRMRSRSFDEDGVVERLGVGPSSVPDLLALVGDTADGIPGLPRFGAKTAAALLRAHPHLEDIPDDPDEWGVTVRGAAGLAATLVERRDDALLYRDLATLRTDLALGANGPLTLTELRWNGPTPDLPAVCADLGETRLPDRVPLPRSS
jgi:5'-3' exonuclease